MHFPTKRMDIKKVSPRQFMEWMRIIEAHLYTHPDTSPLAKVPPCPYTITEMVIEALRRVDPNESEEE